MNFGNYYICVISIHFDFTTISISFWKPVYLEVAHSLDTDSCINAIRRFTCRRGQVKILRSDNGTNFVAAEKELRKAVENLNQTKIQNTMTEKGVKWMFNTPAAFGSHLPDIQ